MVPLEENYENVLFQSLVVSTLTIYLGGKGWKWSIWRKRMKKNLFQSLRVASTLTSCAVQRILRYWWHIAALMRPGQNVRGKDCTGDASALDASPVHLEFLQKSYFEWIRNKTKRVCSEKKVAVKSGLSASVHLAKCIEDCSTSVQCALCSIQYSVCGVKCVVFSLQWSVLLCWSASDTGSKSSRFTSLIFP